MPVAKRTIRPYWQSECGRAVVYVGDCRKVMATLEPEQFHAIVTDPPYGLEFMNLKFDAPWKHQKIGLNKDIKEVAKDLATAFFDIVLPDYNKLVSESFNLGDLHLPTLHSAALAFMDRSIWEEARVAVPERAVDFNHRVVLGNEEVKDADVLASVVPDSELVDKLDAYSFEEGPHFFLNLRPCGNPSFGDGLRCLVSDCGNGFLRVPVVIPFDSCFACLLHTIPQGDNTFLSHVVRFLNNPLRCPSRPPLVMTSGGAELRAVLSLNLRSGTAELLPADSTLEDGLIFELRCTKFVGAPPRASSLPAVFKTRSLSLVGSPTYRTISICFHTSILAQIEFMGKEWDAPWKSAGGVVDDPASVGGFQDGSGGNPYSATRVRIGGVGGGSADARQRRADELTDPVKAKYLQHGVTYGGVGKRNKGRIEVCNEGMDPSHPERDGTNRVVYGLSDPQGFQAWFLTCAEAMLRVAKPGAHLLSFGGTRMWHRMACAVEDAGFDIRDTVMWVYGSGFPKSHDVSKGIDKMMGAERAANGAVTDRRGDGTVYGIGHSGALTSNEPITDAARQWNGWGTALKPSHEPVVLARKPIPGTVAQCVLEHGTGGLNIDGCRVGVDGGCKYIPGTGGFDAGTVNALGGHLNSVRSPNAKGLGRWPANLIHDGSDEVVGLFPQSTSTRQEVTSNPGTIYGAGKGLPSHTGIYGFNDSGSAARFFYTTKADADDRPHGKGAVSHPTVKPLDLCCYLVRLVCALGGTVLDPFMGSGSTGCAAIAEGMRFVGIEQSKEYADIAVGRIKLALAAKGGVQNTPPPPKKLRGVE
jgi:DNA modification methylase